jgi:hypothetical protein
LQVLVMQKHAHDERFSNNVEGGMLREGLTVETKNAPWLGRVILLAELRRFIAPKRPMAA